MLIQERNKDRGKTIYLEINLLLVCFPQKWLKQILIIRNTYILGSL